MLEIAPNVAFWTIVNFILLLIVLKKFAWKPILAIIEKREMKIRDTLDRADKAQEEAEQKLQEYKEMIEKGRKESLEIIEQGRQRAQKLHDEIVNKAAGESLAILNKAKNEIELEREKALKEIKATVADISVSLASKMLEKSISPEDHRELINNAIKELG